MPTTRSHQAPTFSGRVSDSLLKFLRDYEHLVDSHQLTGEEKVLTIMCYIPEALQAHWESLNGYISQNWSAFCQALKELYLDENRSGLYT
jgi:hypothetical protein